MNILNIDVCALPLPPQLPRPVLSDAAQSRQPRRAVDSVEHLPIDNGLILGPLTTHERYCFFRYTRYFHDISFDAIYRDIFTIFSKCKLGQNAPKFHSWSAYVEIFATKWPICGIFIRKHHTFRVFLHSNAIKGFLF